MTAERPTCDGPVYIGDQGIDVCETCGGCLCCDYVHVDHRAAKYWCWFDSDGKCILKDSHGFPNHVCEKQS